MSSNYVSGLLVFGAGTAAGWIVVFALAQLALLVNIVPSMVRTARVRRRDWRRAGGSPTVARTLPRCRTVRSWRDICRSEPGSLVGVKT